MARCGKPLGRGGRALHHPATPARRLTLKAGGSHPTRNQKQRTRREPPPHARGANPAGESNGTDGPDVDDGTRTPRAGTHVHGVRDHHDAARAAEPAYSRTRRQGIGEAEPETQGNRRRRIGVGGRSPRPRTDTTRGRWRPGQRARARRAAPRRRPPSGAARGRTAEAGDRVKNEAHPRERVKASASGPDVKAVTEVTPRTGGSTEEFMAAPDPRPRSPRPGGGQPASQRARSTQPGVTRARGGSPVPPDRCQLRQCDRPAHAGVSPPHPSPESAGHPADAGVNPRPRKRC